LLLVENWPLPLPLGSHPGAKPYGKTTTAGGRRKRKAGGKTKIQRKTGQRPNRKPTTGLALKQTGGEERLCTKSFETTRPCTEYHPATKQERLSHSVHDISFSRGKHDRCFLTPRMYYHSILWRTLEKRARVLTATVGKERKGHSGGTPTGRGVGAGAAQRQGLLVPGLATLAAQGSDSRVTSTLSIPVGPQAAVWRALPAKIDWRVASGRCVCVRHQVHPLQVACLHNNARWQRGRT
jgi:hypothetical protein